MADETESLGELASNARRLLADAEVVFAHGTNQTAASLAILAMEERPQLKWILVSE